MSDSKISLTLNEAAAATGLSTSFLRRAINATDPEIHLPARLAGARYIILREDLEEWIKRMPEA